MANYSEVALGFAFLVSTLGGDATLTQLAPGGVWDTLAPPSEATPFVFMAHQAGKDVTTANEYRVFTEHLYQVAAVGPANNASGILAAAAQLDKLLGGPPNLPVSGPVYIGGVFAGQVLACWREQSLSIDQLVNTTMWNRTGGMYKLLIQQNAS